MTNVLNESCSPGLIFRWENHFTIFDSSDSKSLTRYQKILWICSLGYKNWLNFAWHSMKFHNCHHANVQHPFPITDSKILQPEAESIWQRHKETADMCKVCYILTFWRATLQESNKNHLPNSDSKTLYDLRIAKNGLPLCIGLYISLDLDKHKEFADLHKCVKFGQYFMFLTFEAFFKKSAKFDQIFKKF